MKFLAGSGKLESLTEDIVVAFATEAKKLDDSTLKRIETRPGPIQTATKTLWSLQEAFEEAGIIFIDADDQHGPGVRLAKPGT